MQLSEARKLITTTAHLNALDRWFRDCLGTLTVPREHFKTTRQLNGAGQLKALCLSFLFEVAFERCERPELEQMIVELGRFLHKMDSNPPLGRIANFSTTLAPRLPCGNDIPFDATERFAKLATAADVNKFAFGVGKSIPYSGFAYTYADAERIKTLLELRMRKGPVLGEWRTGLPLFWLSPLADLNGLPTDPVQRSMEALDRVGVPSAGLGYLMKFDFDGAVLARLRTPTFFDSGPRCQFVPVPARVGWGRARRVTDLAEAACEAVSPTCCWPSTCIIDLLGPTEASDQALPEEWEDLSEQLWLTLTGAMGNISDDLLNILA